MGTTSVLMPLAAPASSSAMFHTFQGLASSQTASESPKHTPKTPITGATKRITTAHACAECKRRKIRCDGRQPCGQCIGCRSPKPCYYDKHRQRVIPSRKTLDALQQSLDDCRTILKRLYPNRDLQTLLPLSRHELISNLDRDSAVSISQSSPAVSQMSATLQDSRSPVVTKSDDQSLANLEQIPKVDTEWDEERRNRDAIPIESDDVNSLSLSVDRQASYLGASSIKAALMVMVKVSPRLRSYLQPSAANNRQVIQASSDKTTRLGPADRLNPRIEWSSEGQTLIDAYFNRVQIFVPMLDEPSFRADYLGGRRNDSPWLALLNMVFTMGSIAAMKSDDHSHVLYYNRSREHLALDSFGESHLETLQALTLMGGYYLHYVNRPNMANGIMGAAFRMACALGLHREATVDSNSRDPISADLRRRTWWSLFCMDTWATTTLGRPSLGRWGPAVTISPPVGASDAHEDSITGQHIRVAPLIENIKFAKISTQIQDTLALSPLPRQAERTALDAALVNWFDNLPWAFTSVDSCPESLYVARTCMKWRYQNMRILLHRPVLLNLANRGSSYSPSKDELAAVELCRSIAKQTIDDISREWMRNQISGWNAVWFMYQASMIPLVSIFWETWNSDQVREWQSQIETVLDSFTEMVDWSLAARRSREVISRMYEVSKTPISRQGSPGITSNGGNGPPMEEHEFREMHAQHQHQLQLQEAMGSMDDGLAMLDNQGIWDLDGMLWGNVPDGLDRPFDSVTDMEYLDHIGQASYYGNYMMNQQ